MPKNHIKQWKHNRAFLSTIDPQYPDWAVTVTFYTALHAVDALLRFDKVTSIISHETRNNTLIHTKRYKKIYELYQPLYSLSRSVRYFAKPSIWIPWEEIEAEIFRRYLYPLERSVQKLMDRDESLDTIGLKSDTDAPDDPA